MAKKKSLGSVVQTFLELEQHLCRIENRTTLFRKKDTDRHDRGHHALAGQVIRETLEFLRASGLDEVPNKKEMAEHLHVGANHMTHLLDGEPSQRRNWLQDCNRLLSFLLQETISENTKSQDTAIREELNVIRERIRHFFFHDFDQAPGQRIPPFFAFERRFAGFPCSLQELSQEVAWFARQPDVGDFRTEITVILGSTPFPPHDPSRVVLGTLREAILNGVEVTFILPPGSHTTGTATIEQFQNDFWGVRGKFGCLKTSLDGLSESDGDRRRIAGSLSEAGISFPSGHLLHMRSVRHRSKSNEDEQEVCVVYLHLRHFTVVHPPPDHGPVAQAATQADHAAFRAWRSTWELRTQTPRSQESPLTDVQEPQLPSASDT